MVPALAPERLERLEPIRGLSAERRRELAGLGRPEAYPIGADPLLDTEGEGVSTYLLRGELKLSFPDGGMQVLVGGCDAANWPLGRRTAVPVASKAITVVEIVRFDDTLLDVMMSWDQLAVAANQPPRNVEDASLWRTVTGALHAQVLTGSGLSLLPPAHLHELLRRFERIKAKAGQVLIREGEVGDYYYLIESGRCTVSRHVGGAEVLVAELKSGEAFGEEALVSNARRSATVAMKTDGVLLRLAKPDFVELLKAPLLHAIGRDEAARRVAAGQAGWLDVRYPAEYVQNGLAEASNIPLNELRAAFGLLDPGREYIAYCQTGRRSAAAAFLLAQHGFRASWLEGGLVATEEETR